MTVGRGGSGWVVCVFGSGGYEIRVEFGGCFFLGGSEWGSGGLGGKMVFWEAYVSDEVLGTFAPILVYWLYSGMYHFVIPPFENYRLHPVEEEKKNLVTVPQVVRGVLLQQVIQVAVALFLFTVLCLTLSR